MSNRTIFQIILFLLCSYSTIAQSTISGRVIDIEGEVIIGVNVWSKQLQTGVATDIDGTFEVATGLTDTLVFTYVGFRDAEIPVRDQTNLLITMMANNELLEEVVVIGYGTQKKKDITGATSSVGGDDFNDGIINSPEQLIRGKVAGVELIQNDGEPGAAFTVRIRGANSIRADNDPLYVIDGYPMDINNPGLATQSRATTKNALEFLNPEDIASIDILKDASAAAIYGARGANGVVLITTKKGQRGPPKLSYSTYIGLSKMRKKIDLFSAQEFRNAQNEFGLTNDFGGSTDWQDEVYQTAIMHNHNLSLHGGTQNTRYRASIGYQDQEGLVKTTEYTKYSGRIKLEHSAIKDRLKIALNLTSSRVRDRRAPGGIVIATMGQNPTWPILDNDGKYFQSVPNSMFNHPIAQLELSSNITNSTRLLSSLTASFKILDDLEYKMNLGGDISEANGKSYSFSQLVAGGQAAISSRSLSSNLIEHYLTYTKELGRVSFVGLGGYSYQKFRNEGSFLARRDFPSDNIPLVNNISAGQELLDNSSYKEENALQSFFGRVHFDFLNKYLLTANFRADGSTRFGENNKYGYFPSMAFAWRLSDEKFLENLTYLDDLKLRISWGLTGNQEIPNKISQPVFGTPFFAQANIGTSDQPVIGYAYERTANPNLKWEETRQINVGLDMSLGLGRWHVSIDYFDKSTTDFLLFTQAPSAPTPEAWINLDGKILNRGWEFALNGHLLKSGNLRWETGVTFTKINNSVSGLLTPLASGLVSGRGQSGVVAQIIINDAPLGVFWGRNWLGFDDDGNDIFEKDDQGNDLLDEIGYGLPDFTWGWSNTLSFQNLEMNFLFNGAHGHEILNNGFLSEINKQSFQFGSNSTSDIIYSDESFDNNLTYSSRHLEDGSFVRLSHVTLSYRFPVRSSQWLSQLQLYISGSNLLIWTDYKGYDPEVNIPRDLNNNIPTIGIDWDSYPRPTSFQIGLKVGFL